MGTPTSCASTTPGSGGRRPRRVTPGWHAAVDASLGTANVTSAWTIAAWRTRCRRRFRCAWGSTAAVIEAGSFFNASGPVLSPSGCLDHWCCFVIRELMGINLSGPWAAAARSVQVAAAVLLVSVMVTAVIAPRSSNTPLRQWVVLLLLVALAFVCLVTLPRSAPALQGLVRRRPRLVMWSLPAAGVGLCAPVALLGAYRPGWDPGGLLSRTDLLAQGRRLDPATMVYLDSYPNNDGVIALLLLARRIGQPFGLAAPIVFVLLNCLCIGVVLVACFVVASRVGGPVAGVMAQLGCIALIGLSPWMSVPYTDVLTTPAPIGAFALLALATERTRPWLRVVLTGSAFIVMGAGYAFKPTLAMAIVAAVLAAVIVCPGWGRRRAAVSLAVVALGAGLAVGSADVTQGAAVTVMATHGLRLDPTRAVPPDRYVLDGLQQGRHGTTQTAYGAYTAGIVTATYGMTTQQMQAYSDRQIRLRLHTLGLGGYLVFAANKTAWNWNDGMFYAFGESAQDAKLSSVISVTPAARALAQVNHWGGALYPVRAELAQALWLLVLATAGLGLLVAAPRPGTLLLALAVLGIAAFTTIFQARSRYLLTYVPVVVTLACVVARDPRQLRTFLPWGCARSDIPGSSLSPTPQDPEYASPTSGDQGGRQPPLGVDDS